MRDLLIPGIQQFDLGILVGLKAFVERTQFLEDQWFKNMDRWCRQNCMLQHCCNHAISAQSTSLVSASSQFPVRSGEQDGLNSVATRKAGCRELQCSEKVIQIPKDSFWESNQKGLQFWVRLFQNIGVSRPSNKSLANFIDMLERRKTGQCNLSGSIVATWTVEDIYIMKS